MVIIKQNLVSDVHGRFYQFNTELWGHVGLPLFAQFFRSVCVCAFSPFYRAGGQTRDVDQMLGNAGPPSTTLTQH